MTSGLKHQAPRIMANKRAKEFYKTVYKPEADDNFEIARKTWVTFSVSNY